MKLRLIDTVFILIGLAVGIILSLQIRSQPIGNRSFPLDQLEVQKSLLSTFSLEQTDLKKELESVENKLTEARAIVERRSSRQTLRQLDSLKKLTQLNAATGSGIRITLSDNPSVSRLDFSAINENFVQATDLRDLVNALYLKDAKAISINGKRVSPLMPIQPVFDSILVGNFQISSPFMVEAVGNSDALKEVAISLQSKKIHVYLERLEKMEIESIQTPRSVKYLSIISK
ncbi:MAG: DUF881 domain-containing protein [Patescibacteria group bacterium]